MTLGNPTNLELVYGGLKAYDRKEYRGSVDLDTYRMPRALGIMRVEALEVLENLGWAGL
jgi:hypothetical protein